jgi:hypothetical protein
MRKILLSVLTAAGLALAVGSASAAPIARVISVQVTDLKAYAHEVDVLQGQMKKAGVAVTIRIWRARFAGSDAGTLIVEVEHRNRGDDAKNRSAPEDRFRQPLRGSEIALR